MNGAACMGAVVLLCGFFVSTQTATPRPEQKPQRTPAVSPTPSAPNQEQTSPSTELKPKAPATSDVEILSDTIGVDFGPYLQSVLKSVKHNWYNLIPEAARPPLKKEGKVVIEFAILKDGQVSALKRIASSGDIRLERAAWGGITGSNPFPALPAEYAGQNLVLRFTFKYNCEKDCLSSESPAPTSLMPDGSLFFGNSRLVLSPSSISVVRGATQQFSISGTGISTIVKWSVAGAGCVKEACGTISPSGLYTAPEIVPNPPTVAVTAALAADPSRKASASVTVLSAHTSPQ